jgi:hypothetical protein
MQILSLDVIEDWRFSDMINSRFGACPCGFPVERQSRKQKTDLWCGFTPSLSAHVRWCEHGAPLQS